MLLYGCSYWRKIWNPKDASTLGLHHYFDLLVICIWNDPALCCVLLRPHQHTPWFGAKSPMNDRHDQYTTGVMLSFATSVQVWWWYHHTWWWYHCHSHWESTTHAKPRMITWTTVILSGNRRWCFSHTSTKLFPGSGSRSGSGSGSMLLTGLQPDGKRRVTWCFISSSLWFVDSFEKNSHACSAHMEPEICTSQVTTRRSKRKLKG